MNKTLTALEHLQTLVGNRFGKHVVPINHDSGAATISINNSRVELTDEDGVIVACGPVRVAKVLRTRRLK